MNKLTTTIVATASALLAVACTQDNDPTRALPVEPAMAVSGGSCSISVINRQARDYFASRTDVVYTSIDALQAALRTATGTDDNTAGFAILDRIGGAADAGSSVAKGTPAQGSLLANTVLACMNGQGYTATIDFASALGANGLFDVVQPGTMNAIYSRGAFAIKYGAEPSTAAGWPVAGPTLFYGYELGAAAFLAAYGESAIGNPFELTTLPANLTFSPALSVGECDVTNTSARLLHDHGSATILPPKETLGFCETLYAALNPTPAPDNVIMMEDELPTEPVLSSRGGGALLSGLSPSGLVTFTPTLTFTQQPLNTPLGATDQFPLDVTVLATSASGKPLANIGVTLRVAGNNGSFVITGNTAYTNSNGVATFPNLHIDKAGGYTLSANVLGTSQLSAFFNITGS